MTYGDTFADARSCLAEAAAEAVCADLNGGRMENEWSSAHRAPVEFFDEWRSIRNLGRHHDVSGLRLDDAEAGKRVATYVSFVECPDKRGLTRCSLQGSNLRPRD